MSLPEIDASKPVTVVHSDSILIDLAHFDPVSNTVFHKFTLVDHLPKDKEWIEVEQSFCCAERMEQVSTMFGAIKMLPPLQIEEEESLLPPHIISVYGKEIFEESKAMKFLVAFICGHLSAVPSFQEVNPEMSRERTDQKTNKSMSGSPEKEIIGGRGRLITKISFATLQDLNVFMEEPHPSVIKGKGRPKEGYSLFNLFSKFVSTSHGKKLLRMWFLSPSYSEKTVKKRQESVEALIKQTNADCLLKMQKSLATCKEIGPVMRSTDIYTLTMAEWKKLAKSVNAMKKLLEFIFPVFGLSFQSDLSFARTATDSNPSELQSNEMTGNTSALPRENKNSSSIVLERSSCPRDKDPLSGRNMGISTGESRELLCSKGQAMNGFSSIRNEILRSSGLHIIPEKSEDSNENTSNYLKQSAGMQVEISCQERRSTTGNRDSFSRSSERGFKSKILSENEAKLDLWRVLLGIQTCFPSILKIDAVLKAIELDCQRKQASNYPGIALGISDDLDKMKHVLSRLEEVITLYEREEIEKIQNADIPELDQLKIVLVPEIGYRIMVPKSLEELKEAKEHLPEDWSFGFSCEDIGFFQSRSTKHLDESFGNMEIEVANTEMDILQQLQQIIKEERGAINLIDAFVAEFDCLVCFANVSLKYDMVKPVLVDPESSCPCFIMSQGRNILCQLLDDKTLTPNDYVVFNFEEFIEELRPQFRGLDLNENSMTNPKYSNKVTVLTGPNYSGKSVFIKTIGIIAFLACIGSFVPARLCKVTLPDSINCFGSGEKYACHSQSSVFSQIAKTLNNATSRSIVLFDEFTKNINYWDGLALTVSLLDSLTTCSFSSTPFVILVTHFHEITQYLPQSYLLRFMTMDVIAKSASSGISFKFVKERLNNQNLSEKAQKTPQMHLVAQSPNLSRSAMPFVQEICESEMGKRVSELKEAEIVYLYKVKPGSIVHSFAYSAAKKVGVEEKILKNFSEFLENEENAFKEKSCESEDDRIASELLRICKLNQD